ncbi:MAG TPA: glycosyltransferase family 2 protein [Nevskiaceae bacterium]|nr:glycosyltransferase family 2 protein [Nevskiaceae bacterium]
MTDIEIPYEKDRHGWYRFFEILPGALSWSMLALPFILSLISVTFAALFIMIYLLINFTRGVAASIRALHGYRMLREHQKLDWSQFLKELEAGEVTDPGVHRPKWHYNQLLRQNAQPLAIQSSEVIHAIIVATYNESREVVEPTIQSVIDSEYDMQNVIFILAYEGRAGEQIQEQSEALIKKYQHKFRHAMAVKHPRLPDEVVGKGGNVTYAGRELQKYLQKNNIDPLRVVVTTLDADNRPDKKYLAALTYVYVACPDPVRSSFQPISMYTNNIWDAPAPMRVLATGNSFYHIVQSLRPHTLRNFSSHAQGMASLIETNFWSVRTIVEDGHQFWRAYFRFDGKYRVYPLYVPIYQDAVLTESYRKTLKAQFIQLRRWTYGASDIAYIASKGFLTKNKVPKHDLIPKFLRSVEGHVSWAVGPLLVLGGGFIPALFHPQSFAANELPIIVSRIQTVGLVGGVALIFICLKTLPPKPARYRRHRTLFMVLQWAYLPVTTVIYNSFAAFNSQTRLMFGWYLSKFDVTEKAVVASGDKKK